MKITRPGIKKIKIPKTGIKNKDNKDRDKKMKIIDRNKKIKIRNITI